ncbi:MAG: hypothetical protein L0G09_07880, partial [Acinetobacter sp.]|nr:hypothetical protein [Acinetobacter sp.]
MSDFVYSIYLRNDSTTAFLHQDRIHINLKTNSQDHRPVEALANELRIVICITEKNLSNITHYSL